MTGSAAWFLLACTAPSGETGSTSDTDTGAIDTSVEVLDDTGIGDTDTDTEEEDTGPDDDLAYAALFDDTEVQRIDLELPEESLTALRDDPQSYAEGVFVHDGYRYEEVGIKLTGGASTWDDIDGKPSFRIKLDEEHGGADYGGLTKLNLHNMRGDDAQAREIVASAVWAAAGLVAPRAAYAEVYVNGESYGLYTNVEEPDEAFLKRRYADASGDLWEAGDGADLTPGGVQNYAVASGEGDDVQLDRARLEVQTGEGAFYDVADGVLDMESFLTLWAWQIALGNEDGYPYDLDDHYLYADPAAAGRYAWLPWSLDETFDDGMDWEDYTGTVAVHCAYDDDCLARLRVAVTAVLTTYESLDVSAITQTQLDLSAEVMQLDTHREAALATVAAGRSALLSSVLNRPARVRGQMGL